MSCSNRILELYVEVASSEETITSKKSFVVFRSLEMKVSCVVLAALLLQLCNGSPTGSAKRKQDNSLVVLNYVPGGPREIPWYRISKDGE